MITMIYLFLQILLVCLVVSSRKPALILIDDLFTFHGSYCEEYCDKFGVELISIVNEESFDQLKRQGRPLSRKFCGPSVGYERKWIRSMKIPAKTSACISCSEQGMKLAYRLQKELNLSNHDSKSYLTDSFHMHEKLSAVGLPVVSSAHVQNIEAAKEFILKTVNQYSPVKDMRFLLKQIPNTIFSRSNPLLIKSLIDIETHFSEFSHNQCCLIEEYVSGPEYSIDTTVRHL
jgi:hypothetical protein